MEINNPHDRFFKETFSEKDNVKDLLKNALPEEILRRIDLESVILLNKSFVNKELRESFSDLLIQANIENIDSFIYILVEHKSYPYRFTLFQLLKYMVSIWETELSQKEGLLTPIIPIIFYHGGRKWNYSNRFKDYFHQKDCLREFLPDFKGIVYDLSMISENTTKGNAAYILSIMAMKYIFSDIKIHFRDILEFIEKNMEDEIISRFLRVFLYYIIEASSTMDYEYISETIKSINNERLVEEYMTIAQQLRNEGREEGIKLGIQEGRQEGIKQEKLDTARNLHKLGIDIKEIQKVTNLTLKEIEDIIKK